MKSYKTVLLTMLLFVAVINSLNAQALSETQKINARATGYAVVAARNPGVQFSVIVIPWDGVNTLEYNANNQINSGWHPQAAIKGNYFYQPFDGSDFTSYSSVILSQEEFDNYKNNGTQWWIVCSTLSSFSNGPITEKNGNVGIGTTAPNERLAVNGKIRAHEIKVETANWPDFVFEEDYKMTSLAETEKYIKANKHLSEIPTASEVATNGIALGEMNRLLPKKIEELTLHLVEKDKQLNETNKQVSHLELIVGQVIKK